MKKNTEGLRKSIEGLRKSRDELKNSTEELKSSTGGLKKRKGTGEDKSPKEGRSSTGGKSPKESKSTMEDRSPKGKGKSPRVSGDLGCSIEEKSVVCTDMEDMGEGECSSSGIPEEVKTTRSTVDGNEEDGNKKDERGEGEDGSSTRRGKGEDIATIASTIVGILQQRVQETTDRLEIAINGSSPNEIEMQEIGAPADLYVNIEPYEQDATEQNMVEQGGADGEWGSAGKQPKTDGLVRKEIARISITAVVVFVVVLVFVFR